jgi:hypothetical protein
MRYLKLSALSAVLAVSAFGAASAQAEILEYLSTFPNAFVSKSTSPKLANLESSLEYSCASSEGTGEATSPKAGTFKEVFKGCKGKIFGISVGECKGLSDTTAGNITVNGTTGLGWKLSAESGKLEPVIVLAFSAVHIECPGTLLILTGSLCGVPTLAKSTTGTLTFAATGAGDQTITDYKTKESGGEAKTCVLSLAVNDGTANMSALVQTTTLTYAKATELDD